MKQTEIKMTWQEPANHSCRDRNCRQCQHFGTGLTGTGKPIHICRQRSSGRTLCGNLKVRCSQPACFYFKPRNPLGTPSSSSAKIKETK